MCSVDWKLFLEYLKVLLTWPPVALVIVLFFSFKFRNSIGDLLARGFKANIFGNQIDVAPNQSKVKMEAEALLGPKRTGAAIKITKATIGRSRSKKTLPPELENDPRAKDAIQWVKENPELTVVEYKKVSTHLVFERLFNAIYGTQISLLDFLASRPNDAIPARQLAKFHAEYLTKSGSVPYELSAYINFLVNFAVIEAKNNGLDYQITQNGIEFLQYIKSSYPAVWYQRAF